MNERRAELIYGQVLQRMDMTRETGDEELQELIRMTLEEASEKEYLPLNEKIELSRELFHAFRKLDILQELLEDPIIFFMKKAGGCFGQNENSCQKKGWLM